MIRRLLICITMLPAFSAAAMDVMLPWFSTAALDVAPHKIPICYNFDCNTRQVINIKPEEWAQVKGWFAESAQDAAREREQIQKAAGWLEVIAGRYTPIHRDLGLDRTPGNSFIGQMDCVDEEKNMTAFLRLFESEGLLKFHTVVEPAYRRTAWDQHWAAQLEEIDTAQRWVVDSWFQDYGHNPYLQKAEQWSDIPFLFSSANFDNSPE